MIQGTFASSYFLYPLKHTYTHSCDVAKHKGVSSSKVKIDTRTRNIIRIISELVIQRRSPNLLDTYHKVPKICPTAYISFQKPVLRVLFLERLIFGGVSIWWEICVTKWIGLGYCWKANKEKNDVLL